MRACWLVRYTIRLSQFIDGIFLALVVKFKLLRVVYVEELAEHKLRTMFNGETRIEP